MESNDSWMEVRGLKVKTRIGVHAFEQAIDQTLLLDLRFPIQLPEAIQALTQTVDYEALCHAVTSLVSSRSFELIETVAQDVAKLIVNEFKVARAEVSVSKPWAIEQAANVTVRVVYP